MAKDIWGDEIAENPETPSPQVALKGVEQGEGGLTLASGGFTMLSVRPTHGTRRLIPYTRIEEITVNPEDTLVTIYAALCIVMIRGQGFGQLADALQRGRALKLRVGKAAKNDDTNQVQIDSIDISDVSDSAPASDYE